MIVIIEYSTEVELFKGLAALAKHFENKKVIDEKGKMVYYNIKLMYLDQEERDFLEQIKREE